MFVASHVTCLGAHLVVRGVRGQVKMQLDKGRARSVCVKLFIIERNNVSITRDFQEFSVNLNTF